VGSVVLGLRVAATGFLLAALRSRIFVGPSAFVFTGFVGFPQLTLLARSFRLPLALFGLPLLAAKVPLVAVQLPSLTLEPVPLSLKLSFLSTQSIMPVVPVIPVATIIPGIGIVPVVGSTISVITVTVIRIVVICYRGTAGKDKAGHEKK
jgi:hypothetical protein